ncbi:hypothetical protein [Mucilaginibacter sp.]|uniref:hypothetical protein n=1 Tax=Mucilaginibacter sp. TaxID=1882438 RepID=UPI0025F0FFBD|nr:hypothetical protein [Mucilaginibacter sp.]
MKVIYKNFREQEVSEAQALLLDEYSKVFVEAGGLVKREEMYDNDKLVRIHYYRDNGETVDDAVAALQPHGVPFNIRAREQYRDFTIINVNCYTEDHLTEKWKFLADADDFILCTQPIDLVSGQPIYEQTTKYIGEYSNDIDPNYCKFVYNAEGGFQYCDYNYVRDYESEIFEINRLLVIKERFQLTDEMYNYYLTAHLLPPLK